MDYIKNFSWNSNNSSEGESIQLKSGTDDLYSNNNSCLNKIKNFFISKIQVETSYLKFGIIFFYRNNCYNNKFFIFTFNCNST